MIASKLCLACKTLKPHTDFYAKPTAADGLQPHCKVCSKERRAGPKDANISILSAINGPAPRRIPYINGGYLDRLPVGADRAAKEEFWTKFHLHFASTAQADRPALFRFLGFAVPLELNVMASPELRREIQLHSHGYMARGWGQKYAWGTLPALPAYHQQKS